MTKNQIKKVETLLQMKIAKYKAINNLHPEFAAECEMKLILKYITPQVQYIDQLLDEEIEDAQKAANK